MATCTSPEVVENGYVSHESLATGPIWNDGEDVVYKCFKFYGLADTDRRKCDNSTWSMPVPKCEYHQTTEIVFWSILALIVLLLLLLIVLVIFTCCYFCKCCQRHRRSKDKESTKSESRKKRNSESSKGKSHSVERSPRKKDEKQETVCSPLCCCPIKKETTHTKTHSLPKSANRSRSRSPKRETQDDKQSGICCVSCCGSEQKSENSSRGRGHRSKSPVNEGYGNNENEHNENVKPGCCACCYSMPNQERENESHLNAYDEVSLSEKKKNNQECLDPEPKIPECDTNIRPEKAKDSKNIQPTVNTINPVYAGSFKDQTIKHVEKEADSLREQQEQIQDESDKKIQRVQEEDKVAREREKEMARLRELEMEKEEKRKRDFEEQKQQKQHEQELERFQVERERKLREQHQKEIEDQIQKDRIEQQKRDEEERLKTLKKQKENDVKEHEKELERQRLQEYERQRQLENLERERQLHIEKQNAEKRKREVEESQKEQKRQMEEKKKEKELQKVQQQELARQLEEQHKKDEKQRRNELFQTEQEQPTRKESRQLEPYVKQNRIAQYSRTRANRGNDNTFSPTETASTLTDNYKYNLDNLKRKKPIKLINSNDKYLKGVMDDDIGKKGTRNPKVYNALKSHKGADVSTTYDTQGHASETPGRTKYSNDNMHSTGSQKKPFKLINSNDKFARGVVDDSIGRRATKNPLVYRPYKIEKPIFKNKS